MKTLRHAKILEIIERYPVDRQEELMRYLKEDGFKVTQATVSRDIRELHLVKTAFGSGKYRYTSAASVVNSGLHSQGRFETIFRESVLKVDYSGYNVLVKCYSGMANAACELFDAMSWEQEVVGTLAGDDTFLVLMRSEQQAKDLSVVLRQYLHKR